MMSDQMRTYQTSPYDRASVDLTVHFETDESPQARIPCSYYLSRQFESDAFPKASSLMNNSAALIDFQLNLSVSRLFHCRQRSASLTLTKTLTQSCLFQIQQLDQ